MRFGTLLLVPCRHSFGSVFASTLKEGADHQNGPPSNRAIFLHITNTNFSLRPAFVYYAKDYKYEDEDTQRAFSWA